MRSKFEPATDLDGDVLRISPNALTMGVNIVKKKHGGIQVYFMRAFAEGGDLSVEAKDWVFKEESHEKRGVMETAMENHPIPPELFNLERALSQLASDAPALGKNGVAQRVMEIRDELRKDLREKGATGHF